MTDTTTEETAKPRRPHWSNNQSAITAEIARVDAELARFGSDAINSDELDRIGALINRRAACQHLLPACDREKAEEWQLRERAREISESTAFQRSLYTAERNTVQKNLADWEGQRRTELQHIEVAFVLSYKDERRADREKYFASFIAPLRERLRILDDALQKLAD